MRLDAVAADLVERLVGAYRPYVEARLSELDLPRPSGLGPALEAGADWLEATLTAILGKPFADQERGPLEIFQEAMRFPGDLLAAEGTPPGIRHRVAVGALPGDRYDLAPASSRALGEEAWRAHLAWGLAKAQALGGAAGPVVLVSTDLMDRSRIESLVSGLVVWKTASEVTEGLTRLRPRAAYVDLALPEARSIIEDLAAVGVPTTAFGPHVDEPALEAARRAGAETALPRSRFFRQLPQLLDG